MLRTSIAVVLCGVLGCSEGVSEVSSITYARVLALRVEAEGDPQRSTPTVDEGARVKVLVSGPHGATEVSYAMALCVAQRDTGSLPACAGPTLVTEAPAARAMEPTMHWPALDADQLGQARELLLRGTICEQGQATLNATALDATALDATALGECTAPNALGVSFLGRVQLIDNVAENANHHPTLQNAELTFDDATWTEDCDATAPPDGKEHTLSIALHAANRERVDDEPETFLISWFTNLGDLNQHFTVLESDQREDTSLSVKWTAPRATDATDRDAATITLVLRDQRGGVDWITRTVCLE